LSFDRNGIGFKGEAIIRKWLVKHGYMILSASQIEMGGAPMLMGHKEKLILPDNLVWKEGVPEWVEIKTKTTATRHRNPPYQRWEHGLPLRQWNSYCRVQEKTKIPVSIAILQLDNKWLYISRLESLKRGARVSEMDREDHVFLNLLDRNNSSAFDKWYKIDELLPDPVQPLAWRTKEQSNDPLIRQMKLDLLLDSERSKLDGYLS
jgi:hypothetical protein